MANLQAFTIDDNLRSQKELITDFYNVTFTEHPVNGIVSVNSGTKNNIIIEEEILTDGIISIERNNLVTPSIVFLNNYIVLDEGLSININLNKATFYINIIKSNDIIQYDVHVEKESKELLDKIYQLISNYKQNNINSISIRYPGKITITNIINGKNQTEYIDFYDTGKKKRKKR